MARIVKKAEYSLRRNEILDIAQRLVFTKGYEQMTIHDLLVELDISKGAFYHYFDSKAALLEALIERMMDEALHQIEPITVDPDLTALQKLQRLFATAAGWKTERKEFFLAMIKGWYADDNAVVRLKVNAAGQERIAPILSRIIQQGIDEGVFSPGCDGQIGAVVWTVLQGLSDAITRLLLSGKSGAETVEQVDQILSAYTSSLERVLGAPSGSVYLLDPDILHTWFTAVPVP